MNFDKAYAQFMEKHIEESSGLRKEKLLKDLGPGEKLFLKDGWWEAFGNFDYLYPEFMVRDYQDGYRFLDLAYLRPPFWLNFEIDGFRTHQSRIDRAKFSDDRDRQNMLVLDDWKVFRFSYDKLRDQKRACQAQLLQIIGRLYGDPSKYFLSPQERIIMQHAGRYSSAFTPSQAADWLGVTEKQARKYLHQLVDKNQIVPESGSERIRTYKLAYGEKIDSLSADERKKVERA